MRLAARISLVSASALAIAACGKSQPAQDQNIVIDDSANAAANAEIETLPPDESSGTASNELVNGNDNPDVSDFNASSNTD